MQKYLQDWELELMQEHQARRSHSHTRSPRTCPDSPTHRSTEDTHIESSPRQNVLETQAIQGGGCRGNGPGGGKGGRGRGKVLRISDTFSNPSVQVPPEYPVARIHLPTKCSGEYGVARAGSAVNRSPESYREREHESSRGGAGGKVKPGPSIKKSKERWWSKYEHNQ